MADLDAAEWKRGQIESLMLEEEQLAAGMREAIRNAHAEIDALNAEKIRLNQHWQSNLLALQRAHEALANTHQAIRSYIRLKIYRFLLSNFRSILFCLDDSSTGTRRRAGRRSYAAF